MNKLILCTFVALTILAIHVRWSDGVADTFLDDFTPVNSQEAKRNLEVEELLKDGDMNAAKRRANLRHRRMFEEENRELMESYRRALLEDDEDDDDVEKECISEVHNKKRNEEATCVQFEKEIKWIFSDKSTELCSDVTKERFKFGMAILRQFTNCSYNEVEEGTEDTADIIITCGNINAAPMGKSSYKTVTVQELNGKASKKIVNHELAHTCCLPHVQQYPGSEAIEIIHFDCVITDFRDQYTTKKVSDCDQSGVVKKEYISVTGITQYPPTAFLKAECSRTIDPTQPCEDKFNIRVYPYYQEIMVINSMDCGQCTTSLTKGQVWGKKCQQLNVELFYGLENSIEYVTQDCFASSPGYEEISVTGSSKMFQCEGEKNLIISNQEINGVAENNKNCANSYVRTMVYHFEEDANDAVLDEKKIECGTKECPGSDYLVPGSYFIVDMSSASGGSYDFRACCF